ncbi:MAG: 3-deoxy-7-phosphoheptulonate synthase class II [Hyphomicrobiales bacterium]
MSTQWAPHSWRGKPAAQMPDYPDRDELARVEARLATFPPLTPPDETRRLKRRLARVVKAGGVVLHGGDCAESFSEHSSDAIRDFFRLFTQMSVILGFAASTPVVKIGRIAGQFAKPRSAPKEKRGDVELPSYRGDSINAIEFSAKARTPNPQRQIAAYRQAAATLNLLRALARGGYGDPRRFHREMLDELRGRLTATRYRAMAERMSEALTVTSGDDGKSGTGPPLPTPDVFTSHEALLLGYEQALTRLDPTFKGWYATSAHMLWIGERTRQIDGAHVEYCRGVKNPLGVKCGPSIDPDTLIRLIDALNPENEAGRLTLICRFGAEQVANKLPCLVRAVKREGRLVLWSCDPMHGNTIKTGAGLKTRPFDAIVREMRGFIAVHRAEGTHAGGLHVEMTGGNVTECVGGALSLADAGPLDRYHTHCDPRLNASQSLELALLAAGVLNKESI